LQLQATACSRVAIGRGSIRSHLRTNSRTPHRRVGTADPHASPPPLPAPPLAPPAAQALATTAAAAGEALTLSVTVGQAASDDLELAQGAKRFYSQPPNAAVGGGARFFPAYTAVVQLEKGVPTSISWDDGCFFCDDAGPRCAATGLPRSDGKPLDGRLKSCFMTAEECGPVSDGGGGGSGGGGGGAAPQGSPCDLKVFVVWTGTDADGGFMTSAGRRFSRYRSYGLQLETAWEGLKRVSREAAERANVDRQRGESVR
jgi:hypothetical protein